MVIASPWCRHCYGLWCFRHLELWSLLGLHLSDAPAQAHFKTHILPDNWLLLCNSFVERGHTILQKTPWQWQRWMTTHWHYRKLRGYYTAFNIPHQPLSWQTWSSSIYSQILCLVLYMLHPHWTISPPGTAPNNKTSSHSFMDSFLAALTTKIWVGIFITLWIHYFHVRQNHASADL